VLWAASGALIDLGAEQDVARVTFELDERAWPQDPRVELSSDGRSWRPAAAEASLADSVWALYQSPRAGVAELRFAPARARFVRLDPRLPTRVGTLGAAP
jgi:hypothetical protein